MGYQLTLEVLLASHGFLEKVAMFVHDPLGVAFIIFGLIIVVIVIWIELIDPK